jgi:mannuronan 5-epimerase
MLAKLRILGVHLLILSVVAAAALAASLTFGRVTQPRRLPPFPRLPVRIHDNAKADPIALATAGLPPPGGALGRLARARIHVIMVTPAGISLRVAGKPVRWIGTTHAVGGLPQLAAVVADPSWISEPARGVIALRAALIMEKGTALTIAPPSVHLLRMAAAVPGVFLGASNARLAIRSATVTSSQPSYAGSYRPFVLADEGSRMQITDARLAGLGWNWNDSYGVAWKDRSTGGATRSTFTGNYFGLYTGRVAGIQFTRNVVTGNFFYGLDPHTYSIHLTVTGNTVTGNGRHGIIFSNHVQDSTVAGNIVQGNAANGIMMDDSSTGNVITGNTVKGNHGDGIVLARSPANRVVGNVVRGNRVGLRLTGTRLRGVKLRGNVFAGNAVNAQGVLSAAGNTIAGDTRRVWNADGLVVIWVLGAVIVTVTLMSLTACLLGDRQV